LRLIAMEGLKDRGYAVLEAADAVTALRILGNRPDVRVVFTDINMPGPLDGMDLAHEAHERWPKLRLIVTSGNYQLRDSDIPNDGRFFAKPYDVDDVADHIDAALGRDRK